jgi:uracil-DNA glycosylase family 4
VSYLPLYHESTACFACERCKGRGKESVPRDRAVAGVVGHRFVCVVEQASVADLSGRLLTNPSQRKVIDGVLGAAGLDPEQVWTTALLRCPPPDKPPEKWRQKEDDHIAACSLWLDGQMYLHCPLVMIAFGRRVVERTVHRLRYEGDGRLTMTTRADYDWPNPVPPRLVKKRKVIQPGDFGVWRGPLFIGLPSPEEISRRKQEEDLRKTVARAVSSLKAAVEAVATEPQIWTSADSSVVEFSGKGKL